MAFEIQIDARGVSHLQFMIPGVTANWTVTHPGPSILQMEPGSYFLYHISGQGIPFAVTPQGLIDYDPAFDVPPGVDHGVFRGRGTSTLTLVGFAFTLDATQVAHPTVAIPYAMEGWRSTRAHLELRLLPGDYLLYHVHEQYTPFAITGQEQTTGDGVVLPKGTVAYAQAFDMQHGGFFDGRGTSTLTLVGFPLTLDATQVAHPTVMVPYALEGWRSTRAFIEMRILPGNYLLYYAPEQYTPFAMTGQEQTTRDGVVLPKGTVAYDPTFDIRHGGFFDGRGTSTLKLVGFALMLNATQVAHPTVSVPYALVGWRSTRARIEIRILPGNYLLYHAREEYTPFAMTGQEQTTRDGVVLPKGTIEYDPTFDVSRGGYFEGLGTGTLNVVGYKILFDASEYRGVDISLNPVGVTIDTTTSAVTLRLLPERDLSLLIRTDPPLSAQFVVEQNGSIALKEQYAFLEITEQGTHPMLKLTNGQAQPQPQGQSYLVGGQVYRQDREDEKRPIKGGVVRAFYKDDRSLIRLGEDTTDDEGYYSIRYQAVPGTKTIPLRIVVFDSTGALLHEAPIIAAAQALEVVNIIVPALVDMARAYVIDGKVASNITGSVGGLRVVIVDQGIGGTIQLAETTTDNSGIFEVTFSDIEVRNRSKVQPDLQVRVFRGETFVGASEVRYQASHHETLDVLLEDRTAAILRTEYEMLLAALATDKLGELKEVDGQRDITYLSNRTGWDARGVAMAALAAQFSARTADSTGTPAIPQPFFYALFRAGLPADADVLYHISAARLKHIWNKAVAQGVIPPASDDQITELVKRFESVSATQLLTGPALIGTSSLNQLLTVSGINEVENQRTFAQLYAIHRDDVSAFWKAVRSAFGQDKADRLQVDGKLGVLTLNNAPLMQAIHNAASRTDVNGTSRGPSTGNAGVMDTLQLAHLGYHRSEQWNTLLTPEIPIPQEIPGDTLEDKRKHYGDYLAAQVRVSYPTASVAHMIKSGDLPLAGASQVGRGENAVARAASAQDTADRVHLFLTDHQGDFEIGVHPIQQYIKEKGLGDPEVAPETVNHIMRVQRVYQITPSDQAMAGLMRNGIDAAHQVVRYDKDTFMQTFAEAVGGADHAARTYENSVQIHNAVLNVALGYLHARAALPLGGSGFSSAVDPTRAPTDVVAYAKLESLFGSMDFCACDHCRSILSPAAYLVDLLQFCDKPGLGAGNPQTVLLDRRPDIQHLPLTCENTNTVLPYIDVVNETLEYFVARGHSLTGYQGHDTDGASSEDLLASPQSFHENIREDAYTILCNARFPALLPFHQPLEGLRRYFAKFEVPLASAMEILRKGDDLERGTNPYAWRDILMEEIGLSRAEYEILTDSPNPVPFWQMYGFPSGTSDADVVAGLSNAKQYARRLNISYEDLIALLKVRFINPHSHLIPKLERLGVSFAMVKGLKDGSINGADFDKLLPGGLVAPDPAEYGGDIKAWIKNTDNYARIMGLVTLAVPASPWGASRTYAVGDCVVPTTATMGSTLYYTCTTPGTTGGAQPTWPTTTGKIVNDGTVVWTCRDTADCLSFDNLAFRYSDPAKVTHNIDAVVFVRLLRFIRVWKKLGWTIEQTDAAICALYPSVTPPQTFADAIDTVSKLNAAFLTLLPRLGIVSRVMKALIITAKRDLLPLLTCWSDIGTHGDGALYRRMFLNPATLQQAPVFNDNGYGEFLTDQTQKLADHSETLRSACNLTGEEYGQIVDVLKFNADTVLTIPNISAIFRRGLLARKLKISVRELLLLTRLTGLDPFTAPDPTNPAILRLVALVQALKDRSLNSAIVLYLIWNQDLSAKSMPDSAQVATFARTLRLGLAAIDNEFAVTDDPDGSIARAKMSLVYGSDATELFFGLLGDVLGVTRVPYAHTQATLEQPILDVLPGRLTYNHVAKELSFSGVMAVSTSEALKAVEGVPPEFKAAVDALLSVNQVNVANTIPRHITEMLYSHGHTALEQSILDAARGLIGYDDFRKRLTYSGVLHETRLDAIKVAAGGSAVAFTTAVDNLYAANQAAIQPFFDRYPELQFLYEAYIADTAHSAAEKRRTLLQAILPELIQRKKRQQALQTVSAAVNADLAFAETFLNSPTYPFPLHAIGHDNQPALNDLLSLETVGLSVQFFASDTAAGTPVAFPEIASTLDYAPAMNGVGNPLPVNPTPDAAISGIWRGYLEAPENGFFNLRIETDIGATVRVRLDDKDLSIALNGTFWSNISPIELRVATLYPIEVTVEKVRNVVRMQWEWEPKGQGRAVIPSRYLYPRTYFERFKENYIRFLKAASLAAGLGLTANELAFFSLHDDYKIAHQIRPDRIIRDGWLNVLPGNSSLSPDPSAALLKPLEALLSFSRIKAAISSEDESLLTVLRDPAMATQKVESLLFAITRWDSVTLTDIFTQFGITIEELNRFDLFRRLYDACALTQAVGVSAKTLIHSTTNEPTADSVRDLQAALRARYDEASWRDVVKPISNEMRSLQRDTLVSYILHQMRSIDKLAHIDTPDKLFEYFLMDVQMDPCMETSRIRHALSSVQLFIERCLMNLEQPDISSSAIDAKQWAWMKRYRVWEANRKVFLYPENWLEPELRDNQSSFFKETMSELLQGDITEDRAAIAVGNYLSKLEEVSKLEPCGIHHAQSNDVDHIVARTAGGHRKYYYRRREGTSWTPWEQIKLDIEDNPVVPFVWNDRLLLFWLRILKQVPPEPTKAVEDAVFGEPRGRFTQPKREENSGFNSTGVFNDFKSQAHDTAEKKIAVQAVLCWSEYSSGKWQPTRTSEINRPAALGEYQAAEFDRSKLRVAITGNKPLAISISHAGTTSSFLLYNTHSIPVLQQRASTLLPLPPPPGKSTSGLISPPPGQAFPLIRSRKVDQSTDQTFALSYQDGATEFTRKLLSRQLFNRNVIQPRHDSVDIWQAPFLYDDCCHAFYVTSRAQQEKIVSRFRPYDLHPTKVLLGENIVPQVLETIRKPPSLKEGILIGGNPGVSDDILPVQSNRRNMITVGLKTRGTVRYGGVPIGPAGGVAFDVSEGATPVQVPNVVGQSASDAEQTIRNTSGIALGPVQRQFDSTPKDQVVKQEPAGGATVVPGTAVLLTVSNGSAITVPNVVGKPVSEATTQLTAAKLKSTDVEQEDATGPYGVVITQNPAAGTAVAQGSTVTLTVYKPPLVTVPDVVNQAAEAATTTLQNAKLTSAVVEQEDATGPYKVVIAQTPVAGTAVAQGSAITLTVYKPPLVTVPDVMNQAVAAATTTLQNAKLAPSIVEREDATGPYGVVISQTPAAGMAVAQGSTVTLTIYKPSLVTVPDVMNQAVAAAATTLQNAKLAPSIVEREDATGPYGVVISQTPAAGMAVAQGSTVTLTVYKQPSVTVPDVINRTLGEATASLAAVGLKVTSTRKFADQVKDQVIGQQPSGGTTVDRGSSVALTISDGKPVAVPSVVGLPLNDAKTTVTNAGLKLGQVRNESSPEPAGTVIFQDPFGGKQVALGSAVNLKVSDGIIVTRRKSQPAVKSRKKNR